MNPHTLVPRVKKLWIDALRSGKYKQAVNALKDIKNDGTVRGYCCLGVLQELYNIEHNLPLNEGMRDENGRAKPFPQLQTLLWATGKDRDPHTEGLSLKVEIKGKEVCVAELNDGEHNLPSHDFDHRFTFEEIADLVEEQL